MALYDAEMAVTRLYVSSQPLSIGTLSCQHGIIQNINGPRERERDVLGFDVHTKKVRQSKLLQLPRSETAATPS
jgi:hypothetical protein